MYYVKNTAHCNRIETLVETYLSLLTVCVKCPAKMSNQHDAVATLLLVVVIATSTTAAAG